jgi:hypothetical protein
MESDMSDFMKALTAAAVMVSAALIFAFFTTPVKAASPDPKLPLIAHDKTVTVLLTDAACTDKAIASFLVDIGQDLKDFHAATYTKNDSVSIGCFRFLRLDNMDGPVVGIGVVWDDGTFGEAPMNVFKEPTADEVNRYSATVRGTRM